MDLIHGGDVTSYLERHPDRPVLDLSSNINPLGLPASVRQALSACGEACARYPDPLCRELTAAIASFEGLPPEWVLCGNGASDLIWRIPQALGSGRALVPAPTFADYALSLAAAGWEVRQHPLSRDRGFPLDDSFVDAVVGNRLVYLCSPNNPTGALTPPNLTEKILRRCREQGAVLVVDECFLDFVEDGGRYSMKAYLAQADNLIILRAFTKLFAMPGLRLGYMLCSNRSLLETVYNSGPCWSVSAPAQLCGVAALEDTAYLEKTRRLLPRWRQDLAESLAGLGLRVYPPTANYIFFEAEPGLSQKLENRGILLRSCANYVGLDEGFYRTAVRTPEENHILIRELEAVLHNG